MSSHHWEQARTAMEVPWDKARERRVLRRALDTWRRRARRKRGLEVLVAVAAALVLGRAMPRAPSGDDEAQPVIAVPAAHERDLAIPLTGDAAKSTTQGASGGFAGTGGHGGGSTGLGGSAGTG